jgi:choline kinase
VTHALILAAGVGSRLALADDRPKCLVEIGGRPLLDRYLDALEPLGIPVTIAVGHQADAIAAQVGDRARLVFNPRFRQGSVVTLHAALASFASLSDPLLLLDGDVYAPPRFFEALEAHRGNALLIDLGTVFTDEQYMAGITAGEVRQLRRGPVPGHDQQGEWVGFARLEPDATAALRLGVGAQVARGEVTTGYEDALASLLDRHGFAAIATRGAPWVEIDFATDLQRARELAAADHRETRSPSPLTDRP